MPIDPTRLPALEQELIYSKQVKAGGQLPDPGRTAAIEAEIALHRAALADDGKAAEEKPQESNVSKDYEAPSERSDVKVEKAAKKSPTKRAADGDELETASATEAAGEAPLETA